MTRLIISIAVLCITTAAGAWAQEPIVALDIRPAQRVVNEAVWNRPIAIASMQEAAGYFENGALETCAARVDFAKQFLLVFAWQGSGGDRLSYTAAESFPEQISFSLKRGLTRDLRTHTRVYALRSNVTWSIQENATGLNETAVELPKPCSRAWMGEADRKAAGAEP